MLDRFRAFLARPRIREFMAFFGGSAVGLAIDLIGFQLLIHLGLQPWLANAISSLLSITAVYFLVTRYSFAVGMRLSTYLLFVGWYCLSIVVFSTLIQVATTASGWDPFLWKLMSIPLSFTANYLFSRFLFLPRQRRDAEGDPETN